MKRIGTSELKAHLSEILRLVDEEGEVIEVTRRGRVLARVEPVRHVPAIDRDANGAWTDLNKLIAEISLGWPADVTARQAIDDVRRKL